MIQHDTNAARTVRATIEKYAPTALKAITPADDLISNILSQLGDPWLTPRYAQDSLRKKLNVCKLALFE